MGFGGKMCLAEWGKNQLRVWKWVGSCGNGVKMGGKSILVGGNGVKINWWGDKVTKHEGLRDLFTKHLRKHEGLRE